MCSVVYDSLRPHGVQHARIPCPSLSSRVCSDSFLLNQWCLSNHLILWGPLLLPSIFPSIRAFSNEAALPIRWPKYWSFSLSINPSSEYSGLISFRIDWFDLLSVQGTLKNVVQHHSLKATILWCSAFFMVHVSYLWASLVAQLIKNPPQYIRHLFDPWVGKIPWRRQQANHSSILENSIGRRVWQATVHGISKESEMTEWLSLSFSHLYRTTGKTIALTIWTLVAKLCLCFSIHCLGLSQLLFQGPSTFDFVAAVTISSDFGAQENSLSLFPILPLLFAMKWRDWMPWSSFFECWVCSLLFHSSFTFIKRLCSSSFHSVQFSHSVMSDSLSPHESSTPGLPVHHQFLKFTQTHVYQANDAIQPCHPLSSPSPPAPNPSHHQSLFQWVNSSQ